MRKLFCLLLALALLCAALPAFAAETAELGKPFQDFTVTTIDGEEFTLSKALETHEAVYVNLFATWCPPCEMEFPFLQEAYEEYSDRVAVIVISIEDNDSVEKLAEYRESHSLTMPIAPAGDDWIARYTEAYAIPVSMMIDRFGNLTLRHEGAVTDADAFRRMFETFLGESYTETKTYQEIPKATLTMEFPSDEALSAALNAEGSAIAFTSDPLHQDYPFLPAEQDGQTGVSPFNTDQRGVDFSCRAEITAQAGDALTFEVSCDLILGSNSLFVEVDGEIMKYYMGRQDGRAWTIALPEGEHEVRFVYEQWEPQETGKPFLTRARLLSSEEAEAALAALPVYPAFETADIVVSNEAAKRGYFEYMGAPALVGYVLNGGAADLELTVPADADPENVFFLDTTRPDDFMRLSDLLTEDGAGYHYRMQLEPEAGSAYAVMQCLYPRFTVQLAVMQDADAVQQVIDENAQQGYALTWVPEPDQETEEETEATYTVYVVDQNGSPVPGAMINFCTDESCQFFQSDDSGVITFTGAPYAYHLQILKLPEGYSFDPDFEAYTEPHTSELTVTVKKD